MTIETDAEKIARLKQWVADCQAGMYINCVYCGHRYGPDDEVPAAMADVLKEHIEQCPEHPLSHAKARIEQLRDALDEHRQALDGALDPASDEIHCSCCAPLRVEVERLRPYETDYLGLRTMCGLSCEDFTQTLANHIDSLYGCAETSEEPQNEIVEDPKLEE